MTVTTLDAALAPVTEEPPPAARRPGAMASLLRNKLAVLCGAYLFVLVFAVAAAPLLAPYSPGAQDLSHVLTGPTGRHWLGTDQLGEDILTRLLYGGRPALLDVLIAAATFLLAGLPLGLLAGYKGGLMDRVASRVADLMFSLPAIVILLMVVAVFPNDDAIAMITLGLLASPGLFRVVRGTTVGLREELFIRVSVLSGLRTGTILRRHVAPNLIGPIIVQGSLLCAGALIAESGLSFLGLLSPDTAGPTWGNMVADASNVLIQDPWMLVPTGGVIALTVIAISLLGDAIRDASVGRSIGSVPLVRQLALPSATAVPPTSTTGPLNSTSALLEVRSLEVTLRVDKHEFQVLTDVTLSVGTGEAVGIVGESGCGKTLTARSILGLLPAGGRVTGGSIRFADRELTALTERELNEVRGRGIALVSQDAVAGLDPTFTVGSQLREVIRLHAARDGQSIARRAADTRAIELLEMVRLPEPTEVLGLRPHQLSGGMAQRVGIAIALAANPRLLIADEPTTALDVTVQREVLDLLSDLRRRLGMALLLVTHDWGVLAEVCDRAVVMYAGEIVEEAAVEALCTCPRHPYSAALLAANPRSADPRAELPTIPGRVPAPSAWPKGCRFAPRCPRATDQCRGEPIPLLDAPGRHKAAMRCIHPIVSEAPR